MFELVGGSRQIVNLAENIVFVRIAGSFGSHDDQFFQYPRISEAEPLSCQFTWSEKTRLATAEERAELPSGIEYVTIRLVEGTGGKGALNLPDKTKIETMKLVCQALLCGAEKSHEYYGDHGDYKLVGKKAVTACFTEELKVLMRGGRIRWPMI